MNTLLLIVNLFLLLYAVVVTWLLVRAGRRLLDFDDIFSLFSHDIETNVKYFEKLLGSPLLSGSQEVHDMHRNIGIIKMRLEEYATRMGEAVNLDQKKE